MILDYAHTPAALETVLSNIKEQFPQRKSLSGSSRYAVDNSQYAFFCG